MYAINKQFKVTVDLESGIYRFLPQSATGKTVLCRLLENERDMGGRALGFTLRDIKDRELLTHRVNVMIGRSNLGTSRN